MVASVERLNHSAAARDNQPIVRAKSTGGRIADYSFREATEKDLRGIEVLFQRRGTAPGWARWKYLENPDGVARIFIAENPHKTIVGLLAHMPRKFTTSDGGTVTALQVVDVYVIPELRNRGVFLGLLDFAHRIMDGARFGVPNDNSAIFGLSLDWEILAPYERWRFPVAIGNRLSESVYAFLKPLVNGLSRVYKGACLSFAPKNLEMIRIARFSRDFELDAKAAHGVRSADYLNWRFIDHPRGRYRAYEFFDNDESIGYCVLTQIGAKAVLSDFVTDRHARGCLRLLVDRCWHKGVVQLGIDGTGLSLRKLGFVRRPSKLVCTAVGLPEGDWIIMSGDIHTREHWVS